MFQLKFWAAVCTGVGLSAILIYLVVSVWLRSRRKQSSESSRVLMLKASTEIGTNCSRNPLGQHQVDGCIFSPNGSMDHTTCNEDDVQHVFNESPLRAYNLDKADREFKGRWFIKAKQAALSEAVRQKIANRGSVPLEKEEEVGRNVLEDVSGSGSTISVDSSLSSKTGSSIPVSSEMSWGQCYTQKELEEATNSFSKANVLGEGSQGIVYHGQLRDGTHIVLKNLSNNRGQAERDFKIEVEAIGRVRHKNLVRLIGFCMEGSQRILVYEYIDNGNLEQWLHERLGGHPALSWEIRMKIILGAAKGLAYLHEGLEPKVVHRDVKSSNILLDSNWNAKVSDFGFAKLLGAGNSHVTTRVMGTFGYVAPEYVSTGMLTEKSDVFSYGVLVMELITGRIPVDYSRPAGEVNLMEWVKVMVGNRRTEEVADPKMAVKPSSRSLKRALLVALRCVDPDALRRPKMGHVVHMLEAADDNSVGEEPRSAEEYLRTRNRSQPQTVLPKHRFFTRPAFMLAQKLEHMQRSGQIDSQCKENSQNEHIFVDIVDTKSTWKYER